MPRTRGDDPRMAALQLIQSMGNGVMTAGEAVERFRSLRGRSPDSDFLIDRMLIGRCYELHHGLREAREAQEELRRIHAELTAPPRFPAVYLGSATDPDGVAAIVSHGGARRVVRVAESAGLSDLRVGQEVLLSSDLNLILSPSPYPPPGVGETAVFERRVGTDRIAITCRDEPLIVSLAEDLREQPLQPGDMLRWDRSSWIAYEKIDRPCESRHLLEELPDVGFDSIGGLDATIEHLRTMLEIHYRNPEVARRYRLAPLRSILLTGPPGVGKTMIVKGTARYLGELFGGGPSHFMNIKPSALHSVWYSESEANYREVFRAAREIAHSSPGGPVVLFFDEADSTAGVRGHALGHVDDRVLTSFLAELDGLESRGDILVMAATNRADMLDPAVLRPGRLGDMIIDIPRPDRSAARAILGKHLPIDLPYAENGHGSDLAATREEILETAASRFFAANGESDLAVLTFRDGRRRTLAAKDLINGSCLANVAREAATRATIRALRESDSGIGIDDVLAAVSGEMERMIGPITPANVRHHVSDLPTDVDVVRCERIRRRLTHPERYLRVA